MLLNTGIFSVIAHCRRAKVNCNFTKFAAYQTQVDKRSYSDLAYFHQTGKEPLQYSTFGALIQEAAAKYGDRTALISCYENKRYTFAEVIHEAGKLAVKLQGLGMQRQDVVGLWITNSTQWYISYLAAQLGGYITACINPALQAQELDYALKKAKVHTLITTEQCGKQNFYKILKSLLPTAGAAVPHAIDTTQFPHLRHVIIAGKSSSGEFTNWAELLCEPSSTEVKLIDELNENVRNIKPENASSIQFTSGTTGKPKLAVLSNFSFLNQGYYFGRALKLHNGHKHICMTLPMFHVFGLSVVNAAVKHGATLVLPSPTFDSKAALESIANEGCHLILGTPTMYVGMLEEQMVSKHATNTLELGIVGGAACSPEIYAQTKKIFNLKEFLVGYGMSEACAAFFTQEGTESVEEASQTIGRLYDHVEAKVINDKGEVVKFGELGELCVRGYVVMTEYQDDADKTKETLDKHGWLKTGDKCILQSDGVARIAGRNKDMIIRGGENIFPKEIEDFLDTHEDIIESQVVGVPDKRMGEEICAYIRLRSGANKLTQEDVKKFCQGKIAHFKVPRYVRCVEEYPKTTSGKIKKYELQEWFQKESES
ncbi:medium-chain acyl-CoA ligase ACSF2, mitochondrial-like [Bactrocera neohumeralis]|uniref:medium-chain acyl-CoA ligase ACSF2, mitochondrial-like n=1 Tax=Bactrocera neohumeralis TaxID=98809 RepID=UPI00216653E0|nr:medium-chain acyl-CoA ligase ACSF2, mitochondrial-like [Bactrocera neohumeralis]